MRLRGRRAFDKWRHAGHDLELPTTTGTAKEVLGCDDSITRNRGIHRFSMPIGHEPFELVSRRLVQPEDLAHQSLNRSTEQDGPIVGVFAEGVDIDHPEGRGIEHLRPACSPRKRDPSCLAVITPAGAVSAQNLFPLPLSATREAEAPSLLLDRQVDAFAIGEELRIPAFRPRCQRLPSGYGSCDET
jgi:hypothetical protein